VGYLEEEAVKTYTHGISDLDKGRLPEWSTQKVDIQAALSFLHSSPSK